MALHLVTGGSGFVGSNIAKMLVARGEDVRVLDLFRDESLPPSIEMFEGDILDSELVAHATKGVDYVHHNVALVPLIKAGPRFREVNVGGTEIALKAAREANVKFFTHMSSSAIFGSPDEMPITNDTPLKPVEIYGEAKRDADLLVQKAMREGMPAACVRPRTIVGKGRLGIFEILFDWIRDNANIYVIGPGTGPFQFVHCDDLAEVSIQACLQERPGLYNAGTDRFGSLREDLGDLIAYAGSTSRVKSLPVSLAIGSLTLLDKIGLSPLGPWHYLTYHKPFYFDSTPVTDALGWQPKFSNREILHTAYDWFVENIELIGREKKASTHKAPVKQGALRLLKAVS